MLTRSQQDASFYGAMHALMLRAGAEVEGLPARAIPSDLPEFAKCVMNRRATDRQPFSCPQLLAPFDGQELPSHAKFRLTECYDISTDGFGFLAERIPDSQFVVIALGTVPFSFVSAEIVHVDRQEVEGEVQFKIGCRFLERLGKLSSE